MRKIFKTLIIIVLCVAALEMISTFALYEYYGHEEKDLRPAGSATLMLVNKVIRKAHGERDETVVSIDHGPLYDIDDALGFIMRPGRYRIREELENRSHVFDLTINDKGRRVTAYAPVESTKRIFVVGDSSVFGWGLYDEQTIPWLLQVRFPGFEIVNMSVNSYSTIQAMLQLGSIMPPIGPNDTIVIIYHPLTNELNVAKDEVLDTLSSGYEMQLGNPERMHQLKLPFGGLDEHGALVVHRIALQCAHATGGECARPAFNLKTAIEVTQRAFDQIIALHPGHLVIGQLSGADDDPDVRYLAVHGATLADLRGVDGVPFEEDLIPSDHHGGPFWQVQVYLRLAEILERQKIVP